MRTLARVLLSIACAAGLAGTFVAPALGQGVLEPAPFAILQSSARLHLPSDVTTANGVSLPAGTYSIQLSGPLLQKVARPSLSLGFWPGPGFVLRRLDGSNAVPVDFVRLKTSIEVKVVYDLPGLYLEQQQIRQRFGTAAVPVIRNGKLVAIQYEGANYYINEAHREGPGLLKPAGRVPAGQPGSKQPGTP